MFNLKCTDGKVKALLRSGRDLVTTTISVTEAKKIMDSGEIVKSDIATYPIHVGEWYFEGELVEEKKPQPPIKGRKR